MQSARPRQMLFLAATIYAATAAASLLLAMLWAPLGLSGPLTPAQFEVQWFRQVVGTLDGRPCPSYPVCSSYAEQALTRHGLLIGSWLMLDRLIHEADDVKRGPWVVVDGEQRLYDPLRRNDFWIDGDKP